MGESNGFYLFVYEQGQTEYTGDYIGRDFDYLFYQGQNWKEKFSLVMFNE